jgi:diguanylate cyclase (GGDEF)-like protein
MKKERLRGYPRVSGEEFEITELSGLFLTSSLDIPGIFESFVEKLRKLVDIDWSAITLAFEKDLHFLAISSKIGSPWQVRERIPAEGTGTEWVVAHHKAVVESNLLRVSRFVTADSFLRLGVRSIAYLPLVADDKTIGSLILASCKPNAYRRRHMALLEPLSARITGPIRHSRLYAEVREKTHLDELTGLHDRSSLHEAIAGEISRHSRYGGVFSLIILGLDSFSTGNDRLGHLVRDELLREISIIVKDVVRNTDWVFRHEGDEFAVLLPNTSIEATYQVTERLRQHITSAGAAINTPVTASLGLANWPADGLVANEIIDGAAIALNHARQSGGNRSQYASKILPPLDYTGIVPADAQDDEALKAVYALAAIVDARNYYNHSHWRKVKEHVTTLSKALDVAPADMEKLQTCALLHDIGKIAVSDRIVNKRGRLTNEEWNVIRSHPQVAANIIGHAPQLIPCIPGILYHHERYDGSGYPEGLRGEEIPWDARIIAIADSFAAMTSDRAYGDALSPHLALEEMKHGSVTLFDRDLLDVFISNVKDTLLPPPEARRA